MTIFWIIFLLLVIGMLALDLGVFHKEDKIISVKEAFLWTGIWISVSLVFSIGIFFIYQYQNAALGAEKVLEYLTAYVVEKSLSLDNIFVMAAIFSFFKVPKKYQHRVLFWGILGAIVLRGIFIFAGTALIVKFSWLMYVFGVLLIVSAIKMGISKEDHDEDLSKNFAVKIAKKFYRVTPSFHGHAFTVIIDGVRHITPLLLALFVIETSDVMFAVDSIPAVFSVTLDPFIVFTSNIMAILGLRSLYFALSAMLGKFVYLKYALVFILAFVGVKMIIVHYVHIPTLLSLSVILLSITISILASFLKGKEIEQ
jgi:tellurite resistance protein TerC